MSTETQEIHRVSHPIVRRRLDVTRVEDITPRMRRITLVGEQLEGFISAAPDDHVKLLFAMNEAERRAIETFGSAKEGAGQESPGRVSPGQESPGQVSPGRVCPKPTMRDYTPRRYDAEKGELDIDFVLHGDVLRQPGQVRRSQVITCTLPGRVVRLSFRTCSSTTCSSATKAPYQQLHAGSKSYRQGAAFRPSSRSKTIPSGNR